MKGLHTLVGRTFPVVRPLDMVKSSNTSKGYGFPTLPVIDVYLSVLVPLPVKCGYKFLPLGLRGGQSKTYISSVHTAHGAYWVCSNCHNRGQDSVFCLSACLPPRTVPSTEEALKVSLQNTLPLSTASQCSFIYVHVALE